GWNYNSLIPELLDPDCEWVAHRTWSRYTELLEKGCDACLLVGMHARAGTPDGVLCHTISTTTWRNLWFNNDLVGESGINAALCGHHGVGRRRHHRRRGHLPRGPRPARRRAGGRGRQEGAGPVLGPPPAAGPGPRP